MLTEIIRSCGHAQIAEAAVRSIGRNYADDVRTVARAHGMSLGTYTAKMVREFDRAATPSARRALMNAIHQVDQPILVGLRFIIDRAMEEDGEGELDDCSGKFSSTPRRDFACLAAAWC
jgi:hypothetical protein